MFFKLKEEKFRLDVKREFCTEQAVRHWHCCPESCGAPSLEVLKAGLDGPWAAWAGGGNQPMAGVGAGWALRPLPTKAILWLYDFYDFMFGIVGWAACMSLIISFCCDIGGSGCRCSALHLSFIFWSALSFFLCGKRHWPLYLCIVLFCLFVCLCQL